MRAFSLIRTTVFPYSTYVAKFFCSALYTRPRNSPAQPYYGRRYRFCDLIFVFVGKRSIPALNVVHAYHME